MSWFRQYRPKQIKDLDLASVRETLLMMMKQGKLPQVMLFAGPKGTGKTSTARIIGAMLNDPQNEAIVDQVFFKKKVSAASKKDFFHEPQLNNDLAQNIFQGQSFVVQEMDAASNRGIDDIRSLKERAFLSPQEGKMLVFILDEVHMLTTEAFNALLKLLEEPPDHVVFILATTELHKVPATIVSRCTIINFQKASDQELMTAVEKVLTAEKIKYQLADLTLLVAKADGSFRDAVKWLELVCQQGKLNQPAIEQILGLSSQKQVKEIIEATLNKNEQQLINIIEELKKLNVDQKFFYQALFNFLHDDLMISFGVEKGKAFLEQKVSLFLLDYLLKADLEMNSPIPFLTLENALLNLIFKAKEKKSRQSFTNKENQQNDPQKKQKQEFIRSLDQEKNHETVKTTNLEESIIPTLVTDQLLNSDQLNSVDLSVNDIKVNNKFLIDKWEEFINFVSQKNFGLATLLRSSKPQGESNGKALINVFYKFHQEQLQQPKFLSIIEDCCQQLLGHKIHFDFILAPTPKEADLVETTNNKQLADIAEEVLL